MTTDPNQQLTLQGPEGGLEALLTDPVGSASGFAVLCHPHPRYGGDMHDSVLSSLTRVLLSSGISCLRFNFRGVGRSAGVYSGSGGEVADLESVINWVGAEIRPDRLILGGYSFGASIVSQLADTVVATRILLIAPPAGLLPHVDASGGVPVDVFAGDADEYVDLTRLQSWPGATIHVIEGANHFFAGRSRELEAGIVAALAESGTT